MATLNIKNFPEELYLILGQRAKKERRSLSREVIYLLECAVEASTSRKRSILGLKGLGKKRWKGIDAASHVEKERESWD